MNVDLLTKKKVLSVLPRYTWLRYNPTQTSTLARILKMTISYLIILRNNRL